MTLKHDFQPATNDIFASAPKNIFAAAHVKDSHTKNMSS